MDLKARIQAGAAEHHDRIITWRRHLHQYPELSFAEHETCRYVTGVLAEQGIPHRAGIGKTGIVAEIKGEAGTGPTFALRADLDALPIQEANEVPYRSRRDGIMHACGHDVHTASLLGAATLLWSVRSHFAGTVRLIFQPGEEKAPGGASILIQEGVLRDPVPAGIIGQHVHPPLAVGKVGMRPGIYMASTDEIYLRIVGRGGHGALPQATVDPIAISAQIITALQQLVSRHADPTLPMVLTFGQIHSEGGSNNVIPNAVNLAGTLRTMDEDWRAEAKKRLRAMVSGIATAMGGSAEIDIVPGYPYLRNDEALTQRAFRNAQAYLGEENVVELPIRMTGEDFAFYSHYVPACFYRLGTGNPARGLTSGVHTDTFDIDEDALRIGAGMLSWLAICELQSANQ